MYRTTFLVLALGAAAALFSPSRSTQADSCSCQRCGTACSSYRLVERTIQVPVTVMEKRVKTRIVKCIKEQKETYTVFKRVPKKRTVTKKQCYLADEIKTKTITKKKCRVVSNPVVRATNVNVYEPEIRELTQTREICNECGERICVEEPCTCSVMVKRPDVELSQCEEPQVVFEETECDIHYCVKTPKQREIVCYEDTVYELVPEKRTRMVEVCVPELIRETVEVPVRKTISKKILCCEKCCQGLLH